MERIEILKTIELANDDFDKGQNDAAINRLAPLLTLYMHGYEATIFHALGRLYMSTDSIDTLKIARQYLKIAIACALNVDETKPALAEFAKSALSEVQIKLADLDKQKIEQRNAKRSSFIFPPCPKGYEESSDNRCYPVSSS